MTEAHFSIQQVSALTGLSLHTIRYYEKAGLIHSVRRLANGYRMFTADDIRWLEFLIRLRKTGMPIRDMQAYALLRHKGPETVTERKQMLLHHRKCIREQLDQLQDNLAYLEQKIEIYRQMEANLGKEESMEQSP